VDTFSLTGVAAKGNVAEPMPTPAGVEATPLAANGGDMRPTKALVRTGRAGADAVVALAWPGSSSEGAERDPSGARADAGLTDKLLSSALAIGALRLSALETRAFAGDPVACKRAGCSTFVIVEHELPIIVVVGLA